MNQNQNTGLIIKDPSPTAWVAGLETGALRVVVNQFGDWRKYAPKGECQAVIWQDKTGAWFNKDSLACVAFSANDDLETYLNYLIKNDMFPSDAVQWLRLNGYIDENGDVNFSDRFTAKMSGTTKQGNDLETVWNSIRNNGLVPEKDWPMPIDEIKANPEGYWDIYYAQIPDEVIAKGKTFARLFPVEHEWLSFSTRTLTDDQFREELKVAPMQIATAVCWPWNTSNVIAGCGPGAAHGTELLHIDADSIRTILDHYEPFTKRLGADYHLTWATRGVIRSAIVPKTPPARLNHTFTVRLSYGMGATDEVKLLQTALQMLISSTTGKPYMKPGTFGIFGPITRNALGLFQTEHGIKDPDGQGTNFGPKTRTVLNAEISKLNS